MQQKAAPQGYRRGDDSPAGWAPKPSAADGFGGQPAGLLARRRQPRRLASEAVCAKPAALTPQRRHDGRLLRRQSWRPDGSVSPPGRGADGLVINVDREAVLVEPTAKPQRRRDGRLSRRAAGEETTAHSKLALSVAALGRLSPPNYRRGVIMDETEGRLAGLPTAHANGATLLRMSQIFRILEGSSSRSLLVERTHLGLN